MIKFLKWLVLTLAYGLILGVLEYQYQVLTAIVEVDWSYICCGLGAIFVAGVWFSLLRCFRKDNNFARVKYMMNLAPVLGILGTAIGMAYTLYQGHLSGIEIGNQDSLDIFWDILFYGTATSFLTTIIGLIVSILLSTYIFVLKDYRK